MARQILEAGENTGVFRQKLNNNFIELYSNASIDTGVRSLTSNYNSTFTTVRANSANWNYQGTDIKSLTGDYNSTFTTVNSNSANWNYQGTDIKSLTGDYHSVYTSTNTLSSNWQSTFNTVSGLSGSWARFQPNPEYAADSAANAQVSGFDGQPTAIFSRVNADYYQGNNIEYYIDRNGQSYGGVAGSWSLYYQPSDAAGGMVAISTTATTYPWEATWTNGVTVVKAALPRIVGAPLATNASEGTSAYAARADHVHPLPSALQVGAAPLQSGKIPSQYLPSYVDDVVEYETLSALQADTAARESGKIFVVRNTGKIYRWSGGTLFVEISNTLELGDLQMPDAFASVYANVPNFTTRELPLTGTLNGKPRYTGSFGGDNYDVYWTGTNWKAQAEYNEDGYSYGESIATGNTAYPWQATGWTNGGGVTRVGTYNAALAPAPLGAEAYSGVGTKAAREDHVHPLPTPAQIGAATTAQGAKADSALQSGAAISDISGLQTALDGKVPLSTSSYIIAKPEDDLIAKYAAAIALTPNGSAKSATNRASLIIFPGSYTLSSELVVDTQFVDIIGLGSVKLDRGCIPAVTFANNTINVTANNVRIKGISVGTQRFKVDSNLNLLVLEDCLGGDYSFCAGLAGESFNLSSTLVNCQAGNSSFGVGGGTGGGDGGAGIISGTLNNCIAGNNSFGVGGNADGNGGAFVGGAGVITSTSSLNNCKAGNNSFGVGGVEISCGASNGSSGSGTVAGNLTNCSAGDSSFGVGSSCSFGQSAGVVSGTLNNCIAGNGSFGVGYDGYDQPVGSGSVISGKLYFTRLTAGTFVAVSGGGLMRMCIDGNNDIIDQG